MKTGTIEKFISKKESKKYCKNKNNNIINAEICSMIKKDDKYKDIAKLLNLNFYSFLIFIIKKEKKYID